MAVYRSHGDPLNAGADTAHRWQFAYVSLVRKPCPQTKFCFEAIVRRTTDHEPPEADFHGRDQIVEIGNPKYRNNAVRGNGTMVRWELSDYGPRKEVQKKLLFPLVRSDRTVIVKVCDGSELRAFPKLGRSRRVAKDNTRNNKRKAADEQAGQLSIAPLLRKRRVHGGERDMAL